MLLLYSQIPKFGVFSEPPEKELKANTTTAVSASSSLFLTKKKKNKNHNPRLLSSVLGSVMPEFFEVWWVTLGSFKAQAPEHDAIQYRFILNLFTFISF